MFNFFPSTSNYVNLCTRSPTRHRTMNARCIHQAESIDIRQTSSEFADWISQSDERDTVVRRHQSSNNRARHVSEIDAFHSPRWKHKHDQMYQIQKRIKHNGILANQLLHTRSATVTTTSSASTSPDKWCCNCWPTINCWSLAFTASSSAIVENGTTQHWRSHAMKIEDR